MPQSSAPIVGVNLSDLDWRDSFGDEAGVLGDLDGTAYKVTLPTNSDVVAVGSPSQRSVARVAGFVHRIPAGETESITIPAATGSARTDIIALRYDPAFTGAPGPVRLVRIAGTSAGLPAYDAAPPGVEDLPLWSITRQPGQALSQATLVRMYPRLAPVLDVPTFSPLPTSSPIATLLRRGDEQFVRTLDSNGVPVWVDSSSLSRLRLTSTGDASVTSTGHAFQIGPDNGLNVIIDNNELIARNNGALAGTFGFGGNRLIALGAPVGSADAATKGYVDGRVGSPTGWATASLSGFANRGGQPVQYKRDITGEVKFRGSMTNNNRYAAPSATVFTLPVGFRPASALTVPIATNIGLFNANLTVNTAGAVAISAFVGTLDPGVVWHLDSVRFEAA